MGRKLPQLHRDALPIAKEGHVVQFTRRKLLDETQPFPHRALHARSCTLLVSRMRGPKREALIERVQDRTGVDLHVPRSAAELLIALEELENMRPGR